MECRDLSLAHPRATLWATSPPPKRIVRRFERVVKARLAGGFGRGVGVYMPHLRDVCYACAYRPKCSEANPTYWGVGRSSMIAGTAFWTNGALLIESPRWPRPRRYSQVSEWALNEVFRPTPGDSVERILLYYHPRIHHAPIARVESYNVHRWFDARYLDVVWTHYPESGAELSWWQGSRMVWRTAGGKPVAAVMGMELSVESRDRVAALEELRCRESWV